MNINFLPSPAILGAILASLSLPILLIILSHGVWKVRALGKRFIVACWLIIGLWLVSLGFEIANSQESLALLLSNFFAGALILMTGILCNFTLWTLVAWGFTLSMLIALSRENQPLTLEDWIRAYTNGQTLETFTLDRLGVLFHFGLATYDNDRVIITAKVGFLVAQITRLLRLFFGLKQ